jgi:hypothetical protein
MKKKKTLITFYIVTIVLSLISVFSYKNKASEFFSGLSSIASDFTLIFATITVVYGLFVCSKDLREKIIKKDKKIDKNLLINLGFLLLTIIIVFLSFVNVFSHKNTIEYVIDSIVRNENREMLKAFLESVGIYFIIFQVVAITELINELCWGSDINYKFPIKIIFGFIFLVVILILINIHIIIKLFILDIVLYFIARYLWKEYIKNIKKKKIRR